LKSQSSPGLLVYLHWELQGGANMTYEPFAGLLKPYWDLPLSGVPAALSTRTIAEGVYDLWDGWDALGPEGRQSVAEGHDAMFDPARKGERESFCKLTQEIEPSTNYYGNWRTGNQVGYFK
jgi:hypothetical protein